MTAALLAAACNGGAGDVAEVPIESLGPPPTVAVDPAESPAATSDAPSTPVPAPTISATAAPVSTSVVTTSTSPLAPTTGVQLTGPMFSDTLGVKVDSAPGVATRGDTRRLLDEGVWVHIAWEPDPGDASVFTVQPDDIPILEAYALANAVYYRSATGLEPATDALFGPFFSNGASGYVESFAQRNARGLVISVGTGVVLRPYVLGDRRTEASAVVLDCYLHDEQDIPIEDGEPVLGELRPEGQFAVMIKVDGVWKVERAGLEPGACL